MAITALQGQLSRNVAKANQIERRRQTLNVNRHRQGQLPIDVPTSFRAATPWRRSDST